ncbi:MAG: UDP-N-acetylglucosamine 2-epimerase [Pseudomonadales bacterium]|jgi:UDP-N-acetylglucosamine 2-epimerase (non-hydrolysing)|nr:UDP-N-acetylglucosamine 2-epimerase [Pseudomonadales bacterium]
MKNYYFFVGTQAELIKLFPVIKIFQDKGINFTLIASGQNNLRDDELFSLLKLEEKTIFLSTEKITKTTLGLLWWWLKTFCHGWLFLRKTDFAREKNKILIIHGDTISTVMGAFFGKIFGAKVAHIEAGLRSFNWLSPFPEEIDRVITSRLVDLHFCPNEWAVNNLSKIKGKKINTGNNTLLDSLHWALKIKTKTSLSKKIDGHKFFILVLHRQENLANLKLVQNVIELAKKRTINEMRCIFILHENTKYVLQKNQLLSEIKKEKNIILTGRLAYTELMQLMEKAEFIITDGGSNQEESYYFGIPCCILRKKTERTEGLKHNVLLSNNDLMKINDFCDNYSRWRKKPIMQKISPSEIIYKELAG